MIPGSHWSSGPVLFALTPTHGVHLTDLGVAALAVAVLVEARRRWDALVLAPAR